MTPHIIRYRNWLYRYSRCRSTVGGRRPCGHQVSAPEIEGAVLQNLLKFRRLPLDVRDIRNHVESVTYDHRDGTVTARLIPPAQRMADADPSEAAPSADRRERRTRIEAAPGS